PPSEPVPRDGVAGRIPALAFQDDLIADRPMDLTGGRDDVGLRLGAIDHGGLGGVGRSRRVRHAEAHGVKSGWEGVCDDWVVPAVVLTVTVQVPRIGEALLIRVE